MTNFLIIDGNSLAYRAFYALPPMFTSQRVPTNVLQGFLNMFFKLVEERKPQLIAVCFDKSRQTFRNRLFADYKGKRKPTPDELRQQLPLLKELLQTMQVRVWEVEDYEADDLIGSLSRIGEQKGWFNLIVTGDQDALQLVSEQTRVLLTQKGIREVLEYTPETVQQKFGFEPQKLIDYKGLCGDASDNIPGLPGVGPKTATKLLVQYGSLAEIIAHRDELTPKLQKIVAEYGEQAVLSQKLATIVRDLSLQVEMEELAWQYPDYAAVQPLFQQLELKTHLKRFLPAAAVIDEPLIWQSELPVLNESGRWSLAAAVEPESQKLWLAFWQEDRSFLVDLRAENQAACQEFLAQAPVCGWDLKKMAHILAPFHLKIQNPAFDSAIGAYLLNPSRPPEQWLTTALEVLPGFAAASPAKSFPESLLQQAQAVGQMTPILLHKLQDMQLSELYWEIEHPLIEVLTQMELTGIKVNWNYLQDLSRGLEQQIEQIAQDIYLLAGENFNLNSPRQLAQILFDKLGLPVIKKTKTGPSTQANVLEKLAQISPVAGLMLQYRALAKLKNTYVDGLPPLADPKTGFLHTTFHQNITATGRLSSSNPNLQNIPVRTSQGREIREAFQPRQAGNWLLSADYSQIELRILAHLSQDSLFMEAFQKGEDIHTRTAAEIFKVEEISPDLRKKAKAINFGIIYGMGAYKLAQDTNISLKEAQRYIADYFNRYQGIKAFVEATIEQASSTGQVRTLFNRLRYLPEIRSSNQITRALGERTAVNTPIQGTAADLIKKAMVNIYRLLQEKKLRSQILLQVHDELILEVWPEELDQVAVLVREQMEQVVQLRVPLVADLKTGYNWNQMSEFKPRT